MCKFLKSKVENQRHKRHGSKKRKEEFAGKENQAARKEKKSLRGRKGKPCSMKRKEKLAGKENQRINKKQSLPARGRKPMLATGNRLPESKTL